MSRSSADIRQAFLTFFQERGHTVVPSSSLVPKGDPTLLFTNAGMVQFKDVFLGTEQRPYRRAATSQRCMRVSGKHNDLEAVGPSPGHHTFFEMLGNFSFGDYFKREAIEYAFDFTHRTLGIPRDRLIFTVFQDDDDAYQAWQGLGAPGERILRMGEKTNFWSMGDTGPCGPTSELHYDCGPDACTCGEPDCSVLLDNGCARWLEIWNLVFMQYDQRPDGTRVPLPRPGVDTGMGLERITSVVQAVRSNYDTDLFVPILDHIQSLLGHSARERQEHTVAYRVIADHGRATAFLIADGVVPGNEGRNYVLRMIMRRALRFGRAAGFAGSFFGNVADRIIELMGPHYPELFQQRKFLLRVVAQEEERFQQTLTVGLRRLEEVVAGVRARGGSVLPGEEAFRLWDTYGFPREMTRDLATEQGLEVDWVGFEAAMAEQRERARAAWEAQAAAAAPAEVYRRLIEEGHRVEFSGYDRLVDEGRVLALLVDGSPVEEAGEGTEAELVLDRTPFYAQAGGQVGDQGVLVALDGEVAVRDTRRPVPELIVHHGVVSRGVVRAGDIVDARVDEARRWDTMRNHTATHLLHRALREVLGEHARQAGSLVAPDRLRFDFVHYAPLTPEEMGDIEARVNARILERLPVTWRTLPYDEALRLGAMALFGEKYGHVVRMVEIDGDSRELCGGTHVRNTSEIGLFKLTGEGSVGAGLRRVEAVTGPGAYAWMQTQETLLGEIAAVLKVPPVEAPERVRRLTQQIAEMERDLQRARTARAVDPRLLATEAREVDGIKVVVKRLDDDLPAELLRTVTDQVRAQLGSGVTALASASTNGVTLVTSATSDVASRGVHAGALAKEIAVLFGGSGGGRPEFGQAGGKDPSRLDEALTQVDKIVVKLWRAK